MKIYRPLLCVLLASPAVFLLAFPDKYLAVPLRDRLSLVAHLQEKTERPPKASPSQPTQSAAKATSSLLIRPFFRVSQAAAVSPDRRAGSAEVAYNPDDNEYLVVWESDGLTEAKGVNDIYGQRVSGATNDRIGINFRISNLTDSDRNHGANDPKVVYNKTAREYLVVWHGSGLVDAPDKSFEVYGQRLSRSGKEIGNDFRISYTADIGKVNTNVVRSSTQADVAWNSASNEYLVIWKGMGEPEDAVKMEIYGQRLKATGELIGKFFRVSHTTKQGDNFHANAPAIAHNGGDNQYLVVWSGGFQKQSQTEIWGRVLSASGAALGTEDFRISQVSNRRASSPHVTYNSANNEYLVVFQANPLPGEAATNVNEILGQRIDAKKLGEFEPKHLRVANSTVAGNRLTEPRITFNNFDKEYLVLWRSTRANAPAEIYAQRLNSSGAEIEADFQISNIGAVGQDRSISDAALNHNSTNGQYVVVWQGNALPGANSSKIHEIFGQMITRPR